MDLKPVHVDRFSEDPALAHGFVAQARNRELDHLLLLRRAPIAASRSIAP